MKQVITLLLCGVLSLSLTNTSFAGDKANKAKNKAKAKAERKAKEAAKKAKADAKKAKASAKKAEADAERARRKAIARSAKAAKKAKEDAAKAARAAKKAKEAQDPRRVALKKRKELIKKSRDLNGDGKVTKKEKKLAARSLSGQRETAAFFKRHDKNGDNKITVNEAPKGKKIGWFRRADTNKDNVLDRGEYFRHIRPDLIQAGRNQQRRDAAKKAKVEKRNAKVKKPKKAPKTGNSP
ncbi:MAG: hypothetical protein P1V97_07275 [Planctomycetota bacterium]|nr:hypothetical protein [Planctomycetota bacterium]